MDRKILNNRSEEFIQQTKTGFKITWNWRLQDDEEGNKGAQTWENSPEQWQVTQLKAQTNSFQQTQKMKIPRMLQERTKKEKNRVRNHPLLLVRCKKMCI